MSVRSFTIKRIQLISVSILIVGAVLRLVDLGGAPLTNQEAQHALNAAQETVHASLFSEAIDPQSSAAFYDSITGILFEVGGASDLNARLASALAGIGLILSPLLLKKKNGLGISLLMAAMIAVSPIFVTVSRTATGGSIASMGLLFTLLIILAGEEDEYAYLGAIGLGIALASGRSGYNGVIILSLVLLFGSKNEIPKKMRQVGLWLVPLTLLMAITRFGFSFSGISAFFESIFAYMQSWSMSADYSAASILMLIPIYSPALLMFGGVGAIQSLRKRTAIDFAFLAFFSVSITFLLIYPGRQPEDVVWPALPLVFFASKTISKLASEFSANGIKPMSVVIALVLGILYIRFNFQISASNDPIALIDQPYIQLVINLFIATAIVVVFALGWSWHAARVGLVFGLGFIFISIGISSLWRLSFEPATKSAGELWRHQATTQGLASLMQTLESTSELSSGSSSGLGLQILDPAPATLKWALRDQKNVDEPAPPIVLAREGEGEPQLSADYIGQALVIGESWGWGSALPPNFIHWWITREAPVESERWWILIREDIALNNQGVILEDL